jgi:hypothetical protein
MEQLNATAVWGDASWIANHFYQLIFGGACQPTRPGNRITWLLNWDESGFLMIGDVRHVSRSTIEKGFSLSFSDGLDKNILLSPTFPILSPSVKYLRDMEIPVLE